MCNGLKIILSLLNVTKSSRLQKRLWKVPYQRNAKRMEQSVKAIPKNLEMEKAQLDASISLLNFGDTAYFLFFSSWVISSQSVPLTISHFPTL